MLHVFGLEIIFLHNAQIHSPPDIPDHNYGCGTPGSWLWIASNQVHTKVQAHPEVVEGSVGGEKEIVHMKFGP